MVCPPSRRLVSDLSPIVPTCVPVLDGVSAFPRSCLPLSPFLYILVSGCLHVFPLSPHMCLSDGPPSRSLVFHWLPLSPWICVPVLDGVSAFLTSCLPVSPIVSHCLPLSPQLSSIVSPHVCCAGPPSEVLSAHCLPLSLQIGACVGWCLRLESYPPSRGRVSHCLPTRVPVLDVVPAFPRSCLHLSHIVFPHVTCVGWCVHFPEVLSPPCLPLSPCWMVCPPSRGFVSFFSQLVSQLVFLLVSQRVSQLVFLLVSLCGG